MGTSPGLDRPGRGPPAILAAALGPGHPAAGQRHRHLAQRGARRGHRDRLSGRRAPVVRPGRPGHGHRLRHGHAGPLHGQRRGRLARTARAGRQVPGRRVRVRRGLRRGCDRRGGHRRHHGAHRAGRHPLRRQLVRGPAVHGGRKAPGDDPRVHAAHRARAESRRPDERAVRDQGRRGLRARGQPARLAHRAVPVEGHRACRWRRSPRA